MAACKMFAPPGRKSTPARTSCNWPWQAHNPGVNDRTKTWLRKWLPVIMFLFFGLITLAQLWLSLNPG